MKASATFGGILRRHRLAADLNLHLPYVRTWCETARGLELLNYDPASGYRLTPFMNQILGGPDAAFYMGLFPEVHLLLAENGLRVVDETSLSRSYIVTTEKPASRGASHAKNGTRRHQQSALWPGNRSQQPLTRFHPAGGNELRA